MRDNTIYMLPKSITFCILLLLLFHSGCNQESLVVEKGLNEKLNFSYSKYQDAIKYRFLSDDLYDILEDSLFKYFDSLQHFYSARNFQPVFINSFEQKNLVYSLLVILNKADEHGINPELYHPGRIEKEFFLAINDSINNLGRYSNLATAELLVCYAIIKYSFHMRYGLVNPKELFPDSYFLPVADLLQIDLFEPVKQSDIIQYLQDVQPKSERYKKLQTALQLFKFYKNIEWQDVPVLEEKLETGDKDSSLILIANKLISLEFLDTSKVMISDFTVYDSLLINPIKEFQRVNGLNDDGVIGKNTIDKLNITPGEYVDKIKINLERFRWINYPDTSAYIIVNIPDFRLYVMENEEEKFDIKVCTGRRRPANYKEQYKVYKRTRRRENKPDNWETPNMYGEISYLVLNPTWNVPNSIIREEISRKVNKDSSYLKTRNFKVYKDGVEVNLDEVNTSEFTSDTIPYRIVQDSGPGNALGKIKFMFNNRFGIYLHDTPTRRPFTYSNRAVSHGCVRVEKPLQLAEFILRDHSKWNIDYLKIEIGKRVDDRSKIMEYNNKRYSLRNRKYSSEDKATELILEKKIPLFIDYYTAWVDDSGAVNFRDDIYRRDKLLMEYLFPAD
jgi:murein L,D-transpeptidase YcbB/YkuD